MQKDFAEKIYRKILQKDFAEGFCIKICRKILQKNFAENFCRKNLQETGFGKKWAGLHLLLKVLSRYKSLYEFADCMQTYSLLNFFINVLTLKILIPLIMSKIIISNNSYNILTISNILTT